jgi:DNA-binding winged helix-turn-helix (wHTH) protein/TolB-like protein/Tfp pilus assembly protein PilF
MGKTPDPTVRFGVFQLDLRTGELWKSGIKVRLREQPFQVLKALLERPGELVTREELRQRLWPSDTFVDFEHGLNAAIRRLRDALGDSADVPRFVETMPRRGYRFIAPVAHPVTVPASIPPPAPPTPASTAIPAPTPTAAASGVEGESADSVRTRDRSTRGPHPAWRLRMPIAALTVAAVAVILVVGWWSRGRPSAEPITVAVMPVRNMTGDAKQDVLTDAITAELITRLNLIAPERLRVTGPQSSLHYKGTQKRTDQIGRELGVAHLLETSLTRTGAHTRITASLVEVNTQAQLWSPQPYQDSADSVEALQRRAVDDIVRQVAKALGVSTAQGQGSVARHSLNGEASAAYRKGRHHLNLGTRDGLEKALAFFSTAIDLDPAYALAYSGLADAYMYIGSDGFMDPQRAYPLAIQNAALALGKDDALAEAHASLGAAMADYHRDWKRAAFHFQRAVDLAPNYQLGHAHYSFFLACMRQFDRSIAEAQQAKDLEPVSASAWMNLGTAYYFKRDYGRALDAFDEVLELDRQYVHALVMKGRTYTAQGRHGDAVAAIEQARRIHEGRPDVTTSYAYVLARAGRREEAHRIIEELRHLSTAAPSPFRLAYVHVALGEPERALTLLNQAVDARDWQMQMLLVEPAFDGLRSDHRFIAVLARIGLAP